MNFSHPHAEEESVKLKNLLEAAILIAQIIQRQLEQVEEKQRQLEERGVAVEKALRGEAGNSLSFSLVFSDALLEG